MFVCIRAISQQYVLPYLLVIRFWSFFLCDICYDQVTKDPNVAEVLPFVLLCLFTDDFIMAPTSSEESVSDVIGGFHGFSLETIKEAAINIESFIIIRVLHPQLAKPFSSYIYYAKYLITMPHFSQNSQNLIEMNILQISARKACVEHPASVLTRRSQAWKASKNLSLLCRYSIQDFWVYSHIKIAE